MLTYRRTLTLGGTAYPVISEAVTLHLSGVGSGRFRVRAAEAPAAGTAARYTVALGDTAWPVLLGVVTEAEPLGDGQARVLVRETTEALRLAAQFAVRHCTPAQVLARLENITGLSFIVPAEGDYLTVRQPYFSAEGDCRAALDAMADVWGVERCVWAQLPDGRVWWGDWAESPFNRDPLSVTDRAVLEWDRLGRALWLPALPALRPGVVLSVYGTDGGETTRFMARKVEHQGERMRVGWGEV